MFHHLFGVFLLFTTTSTLTSQDYYSCNQIIDRAIEVKEYEMLYEALSTDCQIVINQFDANEESILMKLCRQNTVDLKAAEILLDQGAELFSTANYRNPNSAFTYSIKYFKTELLEYFVNWVKINDLSFALEDFHYLFYAINLGNKDAFNLLLPFYEKNIDQIQDETNALLTVLNYGCHINDLTLTLGGQTEKLNLELEIAIFFLERLLEIGANPNISDEVLLISSCSNKILGILSAHRLELTKKLVVHNSRVTLLDYCVDKLVNSRIGNWGPIDIQKAKWANLIDVIDTLIEAKVPYTGGYPDPYTFLIVQAVQKNSIELVDVLLERGADPKSRALNNQSLIDIAHDNGFTLLVELLLKKGA